MLLETFFWSQSYFVDSVSENTTDMVKKYIQNQKGMKRHSSPPDPVGQTGCSADFSINELACMYSSQCQKDKEITEETMYKLLSPIVNSIVNRYVNFNASIRQDLVMEGYLAGLEALRQFDISYGSKFSTYAYSFISKRINMTLQDINISGQTKQHTGRELSQYKKQKKQLVSELKREPTVGEIAARLGKKRSTVIQYERLINKPISFESLTSKPDTDDNEIRFEDTLVDNSETEWQDEVNSDEFCEDLDRFLAGILETDAEIIRMAIGYERKKMTFSEIGEKLGISKATAFRKFQAYASQLEKLLF